MLSQNYDLAIANKCSQNNNKVLKMCIGPCVVPSYAPKQQKQVGAKKV